MILLSSSRGSDFAELLTMLVIFIAVLAASMWVTKWIGNYQKNQYASGSIEVIESARIAPGKWVEIVRVGDKYKILAVCKDTVSYLGDIDESELKRETTSEKKSFSDMLSKAFSDKKE